MDPWTTHYRGWRLVIAPGRPVIGCASERRPPYRIEMVKGFSGSSVLTELKRRVDEIEGGSDTGDAADETTTGADPPK
jgi:hypothetical protein